MTDHAAPTLYDTLQDQIALVTGGNRGIEAVIAAELAELGATVYAGARVPEDVEDDRLRAVELDVTEDDEIRAAVDRIDAEAGRLDVLVNNAGIFERSGPLHEISMDAFDRTMAVNLRGPVALTRAALPLLLDGEGGRVVNLSSGLGQFTEGAMGGDYPSYRLSKVGLGGLTAYLDGEYGDEGLIANAASPGWVRTDMGGPNANRSPAEGADTPVWLSRFEPESPSGLLWQDREVIEW